MDACLFINWSICSVCCRHRRRRLSSVCFSMVVVCAARQHLKFETFPLPHFFFSGSIDLLLVYINQLACGGGWNIRLGVKTFDIALTCCDSYLFWQFSIERGCTCVPLHNWHTSHWKTVTLTYALSENCPFVLFVSGALLRFQSECIIGNTYESYNY